MIRKNPYTLTWCAGLLVYILSAIFGTGYFNPDEHYQIMEFALAKLSSVPVDRMPWEYTEQIRSSFQPWIAYSLIRVSRLPGITDPYMVTLTLRMITGVLALAILGFFFRKQTQGMKKPSRLLFLMLSLFLWFLPMLNVRFSSETWSGLFVLAAMGSILPAEKMRSVDYWQVGCFCGLAFLCRYQTGICILSLLLWMIIIRKAGWRYTGIIAAGIVAFIAGGVLLDRLFYGEWTLCAWNYFNANIIHEMASGFGIMAWYDYCLTLLYNAILPVGIFLTAIYLVFVVLFPSSIYTWVTLPFILIHLIIPHKEVRFIFPVLHLLPWMITLSMQQLASVWPLQWKEYRIGIRSAFVLLICIDILSLLVAITMPPSGGRMTITEFIDRRFAKGKVRLFYINRQEENPYEPYSFLNQAFYRNTRVQAIPVDGQNYNIPMNATGDTTILLVVRGNLAQKVDEVKGMRLLKTGYPSIPARIAEFYFGRLVRAEEYFLYGREDAHQNASSQFE